MLYVGTFGYWSVCPPKARWSKIKFQDFRAHPSKSLHFSPKKNQKIVPGYPNTRAHTPRVELVLKKGGKRKRLVCHQINQIYKKIFIRKRILCSCFFLENVEIFPIFQFVFCRFSGFGFQFFMTDATKQ